MDGTLARKRSTTDARRMVMAERGGKIVVACHGGVINTYLAELLGIDRDFWFRTAHCSVNRLLVGHGRQAVWNLNETHHLPGDLSTA